MSPERSLIFTYLRLGMSMEKVHGTKFGPIQSLFSLHGMEAEVWTWGRNQTLLCLEGSSLGIYLSVPFFSRACPYRCEPASQPALLTKHIFFTIHFVLGNVITECRNHLPKDWGNEWSCRKRQSSRNHFLNNVQCQSCLWDKREEIK
jgi:hypothetical protein